ncbi:hypothetical protein COJ90_21815 [Priestia megaterium]|uniref:hypothetical protein n=1 Tax=Priestia megaterium TaxID=1404 RepID=UPI000BF98F2D|nr:hypothetical protein [Priestia megaterium]PFP08573.1 hypothetical protein COJ90_21815 [Priestia megaterium]
MASNKTPNLNLDIWAEMDFFKRAELNSNFSKLDENVNEISQNAAMKNNLPYFNVKDFKSSSDTTWDSALKAALKNANSVLFYTQVLIPRSSTKYTFSGSQIVLKDNVNIVFERGAEIEYTGSSDSLFTNDPTTASLFLRVSGGGRLIINDKKIFNFRYSKGQTYGCTVILDDLKFKGNGTNRVGTGVSIGYTDFLHIKDCRFNDLDKGIEIVADNTWTRGNTQIVLDTIAMYNVKTGVEFDRLDKASFRNVDIAHCDIGFVGHSGNQLVMFDNCHVEYYDTYAYKFDGSANMNNTFNNCSCFLPMDTAKGGFYSPQLDWSAKGQNQYAFNNCDFTKAELVEAARSTEVKSAVGYVPYVGFYCPSPFEWRGADFEYPLYNKVNNDYPVGSAKIYPVLPQEQSDNLMVTPHFNDINSLHTVQGTATITQNSDYYEGVRISWVASAGNVLRVKSKPLHVGWHTVVLKASQIGTNNVSFLVSKPNFTTLFNQNISELSFDYREGIRPRRTGIKTQTLTIPFYVDTAGEYYFAFYAPSSATYDISTGGIQLFSGFVTDYKPVPKVWEKTSYPTSGYWYKGHTVRNSAASIAGDKRGWECLVSGSPGTWLGTGTFVAP